MLYPHYEAVPRLWGFTALQDQSAAGLTMMQVEGLTYMLVVLVLVARMLSYDERMTRLREERDSSREAFRGEQRFLAGLHDTLVSLSGVMQPRARRAVLAACIVVATALAVGAAATSWWARRPATLEQPSLGGRLRMGLCVTYDLAHAIGTVFVKFADLGSARQLFLWWRERKLKFPVRRPGLRSHPAPRRASLRSSSIGA